MFGTIACEKDTFPVVAFLSQNKLFLVETSDSQKYICACMFRTTAKIKKYFTIKSDDRRMRIIWLVKLFTLSPFPHVLISLMHQLSFMYFLSLWANFPSFFDLRI